MSEIIRSAAGLEHDLSHDADGNVVVATRQPALDDIIEDNKAKQLANDGYTPERTLRRVASVPIWLIYKWRVEEGLDFHNPNHWPAIKRKLNDPEYLWLRTAPGRV